MSSDISIRPPIAPPVSRRLLAGAGSLAARFSMLFLLLLAWELASVTGAVQPFLLPPLDQVFGHLRDDIVSGQFFIDAGLTLYRAVAGFALACALGIPLGIAVALGRTARWFCEPLISVGFPMPKIAFLPVFMLWFGLYDMSKIIMVAFASIFTIVAAAEAGTVGVDKKLVWSARSLGATKIEIFFDILLPAGLPQLLTGLQVALPMALITTVAAEMLMGGEGLGGAMMQAGSYADSVGVYAGIIETSLVGLVAVTGMARLRRRLLHWHAEFNSH